VGQQRRSTAALVKARVMGIQRDIQQSDGHAPKTVTDEYSKVKADVNFRREVAEEVAEKVGLRFNLESKMFPVVPQFSDAIPLQSV
jgi:hypothetical protein